MIVRGIPSSGHTTNLIHGQARADLGSEEVGRIPFAVVVGIDYPALVDACFGVEVALVLAITLTSRAERHLDYGRSPPRVTRR